MPQRSGLGKGLDALIPTGQANLGSGGAIQAPLEDIRPNPHQPRLRFDATEMDELAASVREHGILQPLIVTPLDGGGYTLIAGQRRLEAARQAGLRTVPVIVRHASSRQMLELALVENVQRADLNPLEEAEAYRHLSEEFGLSHEEIADRVGKSRVAVTNTMRLLGSAPGVKQALVDGKITEGHARALLALATPEAQEALLRTVLARELSVRQTEELARKLGGQRSVAAPKPPRSPEVSELEARLRAGLGTKVILRYGSKGGTLTIHYYSDEELEALIDRLLKEA